MVGAAATVEGKSIENDNNDNNIIASTNIASKRARNIADAIGEVKTWIWTGFAVVKKATECGSTVSSQAVRWAGLVSGMSFAATAGCIGVTSSDAGVKDSVAIAMVTGTMIAAASFFTSDILECFGRTAQTVIHITQSMTHRTLSAAEDTVTNVAEALEHGIVVMALGQSGPAVIEEIVKTAKNHLLDDDDDDDDSASDTDFDRGRQLFIGLASMVAINHMTGFRRHHVIAYILKRMQKSNTPVCTPRRGASPRPTADAETRGNDLKKGSFGVQVIGTRGGPFVWGENFTPEYCSWLMRLATAIYDDQLLKLLRISSGSHRPILLSKHKKAGYKEKHVTMAEWAGCPIEDVLLCGDDNDAHPFLPMYAVILDRSRSAVVVTIRGTSSVWDVMTDLAAEYLTPDHVDTLGLGVTSENAFVHGGMQRSADNVSDLVLPTVLSGLRELDAGDEATLEARQSRPVVFITGHSLGAGVASLLTLKWNTDPNVISRISPLNAIVECVGFGTPSSMSRPLAQSCAHFVTTIIVGDDCVPSLSLSSIADLIAEAIDISKEEELLQRLQTALPLPMSRRNNDILDWCFKYVKARFDVPIPSTLASSMKNRRVVMIPPGLALWTPSETTENLTLDIDVGDDVENSTRSLDRASHLDRVSVTPRGCAEPRIVASDAFAQVVLCPAMVSDHMIDMYLSSMNRWVEHEHTEAPMIGPHGHAEYGQAGPFPSD